MSWMAQKMDLNFTNHQVTFASIHTKYTYVRTSMCTQAVMKLRRFLLLARNTSYACTHVNL